MNEVIFNRHSEKGFTMIELLISIAIIGVLASLSLTAFVIYKKDAEYSKAESDLRNARTAYEAGIQDVPSGYSLALTYTPTAGGVVAAPLDEVLPNAVTSKDVRLGLQFEDCAPGAGFGVVNGFLIANSCKAEKSVSWTRFCDGLELFVTELPVGCI